jgi:hypothetical protein
MLDLGLLGQVSDTALTDDKAIAFEKSGLPILRCSARARPGSPACGWRLASPFR